MKVAMVVPGGVDRSGVDRVIPAFLWLIERIAQRHELHVFATQQERDPGEWDLLGARVHNVGMGRGTARRVVTAIAAEHATSPFGVIHAFFGWCGAYAALAGLRLRVPVLFHATGGEFVGLHEIDYGMQNRARDRLALRLAVTRGRRVTVATRAMQKLAAAKGVSADIVPLGVALDQWPATAPRPRDASRPLRLIHVGDIRPVKDQSLLIEVADHLRQAGVAFHLDIVGLDTMNGALHQSETALRLGDAVTWHGVLRRAPLRTLMDQADLFVLTSRHEAEPIAVLEAAVAGVPTVGTAVGYVADWSPDATVAVPGRDAQALARVIVALANDEPRRMSIAREAQRRAVAVDADYGAREFERIYAELAGRTEVARR